MRLFTLVILLSCAAAAVAQEVNNFYYKSGVDKILNLPCMEVRAIDATEIEYDHDFIRFKSIGGIYNQAPATSINRVQFVFARDHQEYVEIRSKGFCTVHLTFPRSELAGIYYGMLEAGGCQTVIEFEFKASKVIAAKLHSCCSGSSTIEE